jgi:hypothetical protein
VLKRPSLKPIVLGSALALLSPVVGLAAIAPQYERLRQFSAVLNDPSVVSKLYAKGPIDRIEAKDEAAFQIWAGDCYLLVKLSIDAPKEKDGPPLIGAPVHYSVTSSEPVCGASQR